MAKYCPVCMRPHEERGAACCPEHTRRLRNWKAAQRSGRLRALRRTLSQHQQELEEKNRWRDIAMGRNRGERLKEIFGFNPEEDD